MRTRSTRATKLVAHAWEMISVHLGLPICALIFDFWRMRKLTRLFIPLERDDIDAQSGISQAKLDAMRFLAGLFLENLDAFVLDPALYDYGRDAMLQREREFQIIDVTLPRVFEDVPEVYQIELGLHQSTVRSDPPSAPRSATEKSSG